MAKKSSSQRRRPQRKKDNNKLVIGQLGALGSAAVQGQIHRRMVDESPNVPRVIAGVSTLAGIGATMMGYPAAGIALMGPGCGQVAIESSLVDFMKKDE